MRKKNKQSEEFNALDCDWQKGNNRGQPGGGGLGWAYDSKLPNW